MIDRKDELVRRVAALSPEKRELLLRQLRGRSAQAGGRESPSGAAPERFPAAPEQEQIWLVDQLNPGSPAFIISFAARMRGPLNPGALEKALEEVVRRHDALRTTFRAGDDGRPVQIVNPTPELSLTFENLDGVAEVDRLREAERVVVGHLNHPIDLVTGPLFRIVLVRLGPADHVLAVATHHIVSDAWSLGVMFRELGVLYRDYARGSTPSLPAPASQYRAHVQWQQQHLKGPAFDAALAYWKRTLASPPPPLSLPADRPRPPHRTYAGRRHVLEIPAGLTSAVRTLSRREGVTPFVTLLSAFYVLLHRLSNQSDILVGTPVSGRDHPGTDDAVGLYSSTLVLRADLSGNPPFTQLLGDVRRIVLEVFACSEVPLVKIVEIVGPTRATTYTPLVQVLFTQPPPVALQDFGGLEVEPFHIDPGTAQFDLMLLVLEGVDSILLTVEGSSDLFDDETVDRIASAYRRVLETGVGDPGTRVSAFPLDDFLSRRASTSGPVDNKTSIVLASSFAAEPILDVLAFWMRLLGRPADIQSAPLNQVYQQLLDPEGLFACNHGGVNLVLIRPSDLARWYPTIEEALHVLTGALKVSAGRTNTPHIVCLCPDPKSSAADLPAVLPDRDVETRVAAAVGEVAGAHLISARELDALYPEPAVGSSSSELEGLPFGPLAFAAIGTMVARRINVLRQESAKAVIVDCDGTLWKGVCGEDGPRGVEIDPARRRLQESLVDLSDSGILIGLCSRNNEDDVFATFAANPDMPLRRSHLDVARINWKRKSENLRSMAAELGLGLASLVFVDDDPAECAEVKSGCPEVLTILLPRDPEGLARLLKHVWLLDRATLTAEDRARSESYRHQALRDELRAHVPTLHAFLEQLHVEVSIRPLTADEIPRASQLSLRTNQFNLTTIRRSESEVRQLVGSPCHQCLGVHVADRFGDYGLVGLVVTEEEAPRFRVDTFLLSCRVLGRGVEHRVLRDLLERARLRGLARVDLGAMATPANQPVRDFLATVGRRYGRNVDGTIRYELPADLVVPDPSETTPRLPDSEPARTRADEVPAQDGRGGDRADRPHRDIWLRIATELATVQQIQAAVEIDRPWHVRPHSPRPYVPPGTAAERRIAGIWRDALHVESIGLDDNFFELGGHSLLAVQVMSRIRAESGVELPLRRLFETPTVRSLANAVEDGSGREPVGDEAGANRIEEDAQLDPAFAVSPVRAPNIDRPRRILLTGAGGFLGAYLLRELLVQTDAEVLCLMRASTREAARDRIARNLSVYGLDLTLAAGRISPVPGDLSLPLLGLDASEFEQLAGSIDAIYHAAAEVNFLQPYAALRSTNIGGTNEILKLSARTTTKALHYVSTLGVLGMARGDGDAYLEQDVPDRYDGPAIGYFQSKWVAERLVLQARTRGLPATIYRPGVVAGDSRSGAGSATDLLGSMMRTLLKMGVAPESDAALDMVPVDFVAAAIVRISRQPNLAANVFHLTNPAPARFSDVARWIGEAGHRLHTVPLGEWIDAFRAEAMSQSDGASTAVLPSLVQSLLLEAARLAPGASGVIAAPHYDCRQTLAALAGTGITFPPVDAALTATYLRAWIASAGASGVP